MTDEKAIVFTTVRHPSRQAGTRGAGRTSGVGRGRAGLGLTAGTKHPHMAGGIIIEVIAEQREK